MFIQRVLIMILEQGERSLDISMSQVNFATLYFIAWQDFPETYYVRVILICFFQ